MSKSAWVKRAINYAKAATLKANKNKFGKWTRLACERFLKDLDRAKVRGAPFYFDEAEVDNVCEFISNLPHVEGKWDTALIELVDFQVFYLANLFGFRSPDGTRRFTSALFAIARKNAKSTLHAAIGLYSLVMEDERGPQVISAATTGDQAFIVMNMARRMVEQTKQLREAFSLEAFARTVASNENGGLMKSINAKASTQDGLNPSCAILDEIHAHKDHDLLNVLQSAAGARRNPLFIFTTTEGYESPGPWPEIRKFAQQVLEGIVEADHFLVLFYAIDKEDDAFDPDVWIKANPLMESNDRLRQAIEKEAIEAKMMSGKQAEFLIKRVNRQSAVADGWINLQKWKACEGPVDLAKLRDYPCYGGLDLASTRDLASFRLVWRVDSAIHTMGWRFVPENTVEERIKKNLVPYGAWVKAGHIIQTSGEVTDYDAILEKIKWAAGEFKIVRIAYDSWNSTQVVQKLKNENIEMAEFRQGPKSFHPAMKHFEEEYFSGRFRHGGDPVLTWCAANITARLDANTNMAPDKKKSNDKIDDMTALLMAIGTMISEAEENGDLDEFLSNPLVLK